MTLLKNTCNPTLILEAWTNALKICYFRKTGSQKVPRLSCLYNKLKDRKRDLQPTPWPIMTAIAVQNPFKFWHKSLTQWPLLFPLNRYQWVEFSPKQVCRVLQKQVPGWDKWRSVTPAAFGCQINKEGKKLISLAQDDLGQLMALWVCVSTRDLINQGCQLDTIDFDEIATTLTTTTTTSTTTTSTSTSTTTTTTTTTTSTTITTTTTTTSTSTTSTSTFPTPSGTPGKPANIDDESIIQNIKVCSTQYFP